MPSIALVSAIGQFAADRVPHSAARRVAAGWPGLSRRRLLLLLAAAPGDLLRLRHLAVRLHRAEAQADVRRAVPDRRFAVLLGVGRGSRCSCLRLPMLVLASNARCRRGLLLGRHSYAIYLVHFAVVSAIAALLPMGLVPLFVLVDRRLAGGELFPDRAPDRAPFQPARSCPCRGRPFAESRRNRRLNRRGGSGPKLPGRLGGIATGYKRPTVRHLPAFRVRSNGNRHSGCDRRFQSGRCRGPLRMFRRSSTADSCPARTAAAFFVSTMSHFVL